MAGSRGGGPPRPVRGFRPGKEPPQLRKQRAREQFGEMSRGQERLVELFADRTPEQARALMRKQRLTLLAAAVALAVLALALAFWFLAAGGVVAVVAAVVFFLWWRLHRQREAFEAMADAVSGPGRGKRRGR